MKLSQYHVISPPFKNNGENTAKRVLFSTRTAQAKVISQDVYTLLLQNRWDELPESIIMELMAAEILVSQEENELHTIIERNQASIQDTDSLYLVLQPSASCQLGCNLKSLGNYCGQEHSGKRLDKAYQTMFIQMTEEKLRVRPYKFLQIAWFGSEPLAAISVMEAMSKDFKRLAAKYNCIYKAKVVTNGLNLDAETTTKLVREMNVNFIEITLDGTAEFHDTRRAYKNGTPSFDKIFRNLVEIAALDLKFGLSIRCNVDKRNFAGVSPLIQLLAENGLQKRCSFYVAPIHSWGNDAHLESLTKEEFAEWQMNWLAEMYHAGFEVGLLPKRNTLVCFAVDRTSVLMDAFGNLYNCSEVSYVPSYENTGAFKIGHIKTGEKTGARDLLGNFNEQVKEGLFPCNTCRMLPTCGGQCPKSWHEGISACPTTKYNIEKRLLMAYAINKLEASKEV